MLLPSLLRAQPVRRVACPARAIMAQLEKKTVSAKNIPVYVGGPTDRPAVVVIQEIKAHAQRVAALNNYRVLVPDLYKGKAGVDAEEASHLSDGLDFKTAAAEVVAAAAWLKETGAPKVAALGFCQGGALTLLAGASGDFAALAPFYGTPKPTDVDLAKITAPVQAHVGEEDAMKGFADVETVKSFIQKLKEAGNRDAEVWVYEDQGHAFMNEGEDIKSRMKTGGIPFGDKKAQDLAWSRLGAFLKRTLG